MKIGLLGKIIVAATAFLLVAGAARPLIRIGRAVPTMAEATSLPVVIIDPGHGGMDGGAVGVDDIVEKDINLAICLMMRDIFTVSGFEVVMTRETDISIHDEGVTGTRNQKTSDLRNRLAMVEEHPGAVFISLHQNKYGESSSWGTQVFYGPGNEQSQKLAQIVQENFVEDLQPDNKRQIKEAGKNLYLMYNATCPSVLIECGFLSNRDEAYRLLDAEYQAQIAFTAYRSVVEFLGLDVAPIAPEPLPDQSAVQ